MASDWFIRINDVEHGPLSSERLKQLAQQGKVAPDTPVKKGQAGKWYRATDVRGLFTTPVSPSTPTTAKPSPIFASSASTPTPKPPSAIPAIDSATQSVIAVSLTKSSEASRSDLPPDSAGVFLLLRRPSATGTINDVIVCVDGQPAGTLAEGDRLKVTLAPGSHSVKLAGGGLRRSSLVSIQAGQISQYETYFSNWGILGGGLRLCAMVTSTASSSERLDDIVGKVESLDTAVRGQQGSLIAEVQKAGKTGGPALPRWAILGSIALLLLFTLVFVLLEGSAKDPRDPILGNWQRIGQGMASFTTEFTASGQIISRYGNGVSDLKATFRRLDENRIEIVQEVGPSSICTVVVGQDTLRLTFPDGTAWRFERRSDGKPTAPASYAIATKPPRTDSQSIAVAPQPRLEQAAEKLPKVKETTFDLGNGIKLEMVEIQAGVFLMGDENEKPQHKVRITKPFYMGKYLVTQEQWEAVRHSNPSCFKGPKNPVEQVTWEECQVFLDKLNAKTGEHRSKFTLPTEAQWEYACRAGSTTRYCFGNDESGFGDYAWYKDNSREMTHPVGEKKPNVWGLYDMHGNVWEWCQDLYDDGYYVDSPTDDPAGPTAGSRRVMRGGAWSVEARECRSAGRNYFLPGFGCASLGFRVVVVPGEE